MRRFNHSLIHFPNLQVTLANASVTLILLLQPCAVNSNELTVFHRYTTSCAVKHSLTAIIQKDYTNLNTHYLLLINQYTINTITQSKTVRLLRDVISLVRSMRLGTNLSTIIKKIHHIYQSLNYLYNFYLYKINYL